MSSIDIGDFVEHPSGFIGVVRQLWFGWVGVELLNTNEMPSCWVRANELTKIPTIVT